MSNIAIVTKHGKYWILGDTEHACPECDSRDVEWDILKSSLLGGSAYCELNSLCNQCGYKWTIERVEEKGEEKTLPNKPIPKHGEYVKENEKPKRKKSRKDG